MNEYITASVTEHKVYRGEVRMFDTGAVFACSAVWIAVGLQSDLSLCLAIFGILLFLRSTGSLAEKFEILKHSALRIRSNLDEVDVTPSDYKVFCHDAGELKKRWRVFTDILFFGGSMLAAILLIASYLL